MRARYWPISAAGFASLIVLILVFGLSAMRRAKILHRETIGIHRTHIQNEADVNAVTTQMYLAEVLVRDYLLNPAQIAEVDYRGQLGEIRSSLDHRLDRLRQAMGNEHRDAIEQLRAEVNAYWVTVNPVFEWTAKQKVSQGPAFLRRNVLPRRQAVAAMAERVALLNAANLQREQVKLDASQTEFQRFLRKMLGLSFLVAIVVTVTSTYRFWSLERQTNAQHRKIEESGEKLRQLSRGLVSAQEAERKSISRELHDAVGPLVTAVRLELANMEMSRTSPADFGDHLQEARQLNAETLELIQRMAMGLRPSMLDDLGLGPALEWQGRELSRRSGIPVSVQIDGCIDHLPERHRTCIYRVVQEALTNSVRHARATNIRVSIYGCENFVEATIQDDGTGFDPGAPQLRGLGLLGMEERVHELGGITTVVSHPGKGTLLRIELPVHREMAA